MARGHATTEVRFHWLLALMSGRTFRQLSDQDLASFRSAREWQVADAGEWAEGIRAILRLFESAESTATDAELAIKKLDELGSAQSGKILRHLELFLDGKVDDLIWERELTRAKQETHAGNRQERVWKFFEPVPAEPRERRPLAAEITSPQWITAIVGGAVFGAAIAAIGWELVRQGSVTAVTAYVLSLAGGTLSALGWMRARLRTERWRAGQRRLSALPHWPPRRDGFAADVDRRVGRYFRRYVPDGADRKDWLAATESTRASLTDEIVDTYSDADVSADQLAWLIRRRVYIVKRSWRDGWLTGYQEAPHPGPLARAATVTGLVICLTGGFWAVVNATRADPLISVGAITIATFAGLAAGACWRHVMLERRRVAADRDEVQRRHKDDRDAYRRWCARLVGRPTDLEMAAWLDCDRKVLIAEAMRQYGLSPSQTITHTVLEAPARSYQRSRVKSGPWRYSRYRLLVFLLTDDGVRQVAADLDIETATFHDKVRLNFRFDAVAAVRVLTSDDHEQTFELGLVSGESVSVRVTEASTGQPDGEDQEFLLHVALDAAGLPNTLHVLEGIAAEGKEWIAQERRRQEHRRNLVRTSSPA
jgi:hypothetical protein